jgi:hypothetical protein
MFIAIMAIGCMFREWATIPETENLMYDGKPNAMMPRGNFRTSGFKKPYFDETETTVGRSIELETLLV